MGSQLDDIAESLEHRLAEANRKESEAKSNLLETQQEKTKAQTAIEQINLLRSGDRELAIDDCIECIVFHNRDSKMTPIPSDSNLDKFRCHACGNEIEVEP